MTPKEKHNDEDDAMGRYYAAVAMGWQKDGKPIEKFFGNMQGHVHEYQDKEPSWSSDVGSFCKERNGYYAHCCEKPKVFKNVVSNNLKFWCCKNCKSDLGDIDEC